MRVMVGLTAATSARRLFTGRYPAALLDLLVYRVIVYLALMTDTSPPFRLDQARRTPRASHPRRTPPTCLPTTGRARSYAPAVRRRCEDACQLCFPR